MGIDPLNQPVLCDKSSTKAASTRRYYVLSLSFLGCYLNAATYGFQYPAGADYNFFLPLANWLRDPSLYPNDALRSAFPHVQTFYWPVVAALSRHFSTEHILFGLFLVSKLLFFGAAGWLIASRVRGRLLGACMISAIALSGMLNNQTPIGGTIILDEVSEHAALGLALALLAGVLLVHGRWRSAAVMAGIVVYVDALHFVHLLPTLALFVLLDWRKRKRAMISAALLGAAVFMPWFLYFHGSFLQNYPAGYISDLLIHYPLHITLRWTPVSQILEAGLILLAAGGMCLLSRRGGLKIENRLELLALSYLAVTVAGILAGWFWLTPGVARFMLPRADSLLFPYAFLLIQIYGARLLESEINLRPALTCLIAFSAILLPLCNYLAIFLLPAIILYLDTRQRWERFSAAVLVRLWKSVPAIPIPRVTAGLCLLGILGSAFYLIDSTDQLWNFQIPPTPEESACFDAQLWARDHTPREALFLVPPEGCGFRVLSQRSSWGEWSDGNAMYFDPAFANTFRARVQVLDGTLVPAGTGITETLTARYKQQSWDRIQAVARQNKLDYILQFTGARYPAIPAYANASFAIYKAQ
jgi:hypothetical protein